jgi:phosphomannomutase
MDRIFIFDIDGTLTPSRRRMTEEFAKFFDKWSEKNKYYLVTGSDLDKTKEQLPIAYIDRAEAIFTCCGNQMWRDDELIYNNKFTPPESLIEHLEEKIKYSKYYHRAGNHIEDRGSMLNFSVVGRNCTQEQREDYFKWDKQTNERKNISNDIKSTWTKLDAVIGGQISIDIYPKGSDKSQVLNIIEQERLVPPSEYIFIGDGIENGGNDYPLAELMDNTEICDWYHTKGWEHTKEILESLID